MKNISPISWLAFILCFIAINMVMGPSLFYLLIIATGLVACVYFFNKTTPQQVADFFKKLLKKCKVR